MADRTIEVQIKAVDKASASFKNIGKMLAIGLGAAASAAGAAGYALKKMVDEASAAEQVAAKLNAVLLSTGGAAGVTAEMANELANSLMQVTRFEDETILEAETMLLRFQNIGKDIFPEVTKATLDLAESLGMDATSAARLLGKALETPGVGLMRLKMAGVAFNEEQLKMIETMAEAGDLAGAQRMILDELKKSVGGTAEAMGATLAGRLEILKNTLGNLKETIGAALIPVLTELGEKLITALNNPQVQQAVTTLAQNLGTVAAAAMETLTNVILPNLAAAFQYVNQHLGAFQAAVRVLGAVFVAAKIAPAIGVIVSAIGALQGALAAGSIAGAAGAIVAALNPVTLIVMAIAAAIALLYTAWTNNWGGIQEKVAAVWAALQPVFTAIREWLGVAIPAAMQGLSDFWTGVLQPVLQAVWDFMKTYLIPIFSLIAQVIGQVARIELMLLKAAWENFILPALQKVWTFLQNNILPVFQLLIGFIGDVIEKALALEKRLGLVRKGFDFIADALKRVIDYLRSLIEGMKNVQVPKWLQGGSPPPMANWLADIAEQANVAARSLADMGSTTGQMPNFRPGGARRPAAGGQTLVQVQGDQHSYFVSDEGLAYLVAALVEERKAQRLNAFMGV